MDLKSCWCGGWDLGGDWETWGGWGEGSSWCCFGGVDWARGEGVEAGWEGEGEGEDDLVGGVEGGGEEGLGRAVLLVDLVLVLDLA